MRRFGESVLRIAVYALGLLFWTAAMLLTLNLLFPVFRGRLEAYWPHALAIIFCVAALLVNLSREFIRQGVLKITALFNPSPAGNLIQITTRQPGEKECAEMSENGKFIINNPGTVTIQDNSTTHIAHNNVQTGIIGSGNVTVHQHIAAPQSPQSETTPAINDATPPTIRREERPIPAHIRETKREFRKKWNDLVQIAEILLARPREEFSAKDLWAAIRPDQICDDGARAHVSVCVGALRNMLDAENSGWRIPKGRYIVDSVVGEANQNSHVLPILLEHLKNIDK